MVHPIAAGFVGSPVDSSPARETTLALLAGALKDRQ